MYKKKTMENYCTDFKISTIYHVMFKFQTSIYVNIVKKAGVLKRKQWRRKHGLAPAFL